MYLTIDVGNTATTIGVLEGDAFVRTFKLSTLQRTTDELGVALVTMLHHNGLDPGGIHGAIIGSVVPSQLYTVEKACRRYLGVESPLVVGRKLRSGVKLRTDNPREVGADRIANAVAASTTWGGPVIIVDLGTATTVDAVNAANEYVGGAIAPGVKIGEEALFSRTAKLPRVEMARPPSAIGRNTIHAMQSGLYYGYVGLVDALARRCREELDPAAHVVATGDLATLLAAASEEIKEVDPLLTLRGLGILYRLNT